MRLLKSSHLAPTLVVTLVGLLLSISLYPFADALIISLAIFTGQLCIGWTNDILDMESDRAENRKGKPIALGLISKETVTKATYLALVACATLSLFGPLGLAGGLTHLLGVACGLSYNFYFKRTLLSPLPFIIAFASFPAAIVIGTSHSVPIWLLGAGALFGIAAHFSNVVKDMDQDRITGIKGLPQLVGSTVSLFVAGLSLILIAIILNTVISTSYLLALAFLSILALFILPKRVSFPVILAVAIIDIGTLVTSGSNYLIGAPR